MAHQFVGELGPDALKNLKEADSFHAVKGFLRLHVGIDTVHEGYNLFGGFQNLVTVALAPLVEQIPVLEPQKPRESMNSNQGALDVVRGRVFKPFLSNSAARSRSWSSPIC